MVRAAVIAAGLAALLSAPGAASACSPEWARGVSRDQVVVGRVEAVRWWKGEIVVVLQPRAAKPARKTVSYNNIPLTCGWQTFRKGQQVYVVDNDWAIAVSEIRLAPAGR